MKAIGVTAPAVTDIVLLDLPEPPPPGEGQVVIEVEAAGVGPGDRLLNTGGRDVGLRPPPHASGPATGRQRLLGRAGPGHRPPHGPRPPTHWNPSWRLHPVNGLTALQALEALGLTTGQRLLITNGGGSAGALAVQLAAAVGVEVTAAASPSAAERLRTFGVTEIIDCHDPAWPERARAGFDAALIAAPGTVASALPLVLDGGQLCSVTSDAPDPERGINSTDLLRTS
ncbi:hypothetical protein AB0I54_43380 [Streptomyces sp. NPDC050625]|uniref:hypothetical protein n=1 Tax=Streptomyces sp. NPDC050625 TaxID=3154629 RepID=UPI00342918BC